MLNPVPEVRSVRVASVVVYMGGCRSSPSLAGSGPISGLIPVTHSTYKARKLGELVPPPEVCSTVRPTAAILLSRRQRDRFPSVSFPNRVPDPQAVGPAMPQRTCSSQPKGGSKVEVHCLLRPRRCQSLCWNQEKNVYPPGSHRQQENHQDTQKKAFKYLDPEAFPF
jgi:hypothetical protein